MHSKFKVRFENLNSVKDSKHRKKFENPGWYSLEENQTLNFRFVVIFFVTIPNMRMFNEKFEKYSQNERCTNLTLESKPIFDNNNKLKC